MPSESAAAEHRRCASALQFRELPLQVGYSPAKFAFGKGRIGPNRTLPKAAARNANMQGLGWAVVRAIAAGFHQEHNGMRFMPGVIGLVNMGDDVA